MKTLTLFSVLALLVGTRPATNPVDPAPTATACKMLDGKDRPFPCEFKINTVWFMGKNNEVLAKSTDNAFIGGPSTVLPASKAVSSKDIGSNGIAFFYNVSVDFTRINTPSASTPAYTLSKSQVTDPISPGETSPINSAIKVSPNLPPPGIRPNRVLFKLQLNYDKLNKTVQAPIQLIQVENPVTFGQLSKLHHYRDRAEAWRTLQLTVNIQK